MSGVNKTLATHFAAADMYITYIGTGPTDLKYRVVLDIYKACEPGAANLTYPEHISYSSAKLGVNVTQVAVDTTGTNHPSDTLDQLCSSFTAINSCRVPNSPWPGFVMSEYTTIITLPDTSDDWEFVWRNSSRNGGILNLCVPGGEDILIRLGFNNAFRYNNSSPRFTVQPIPYLCQNQQAIFFNGPVDPNGDSLRIENKQPEGCVSGGSCACGVNTEIPYSGGYSSLNPIHSGIPYHVDSTTGMADFLPTLQGKFVLAFRCYEYDRATGTRLGYITRDVQVSVLACNSTAPRIDSIPLNVQGGKFISTSGNVLVGCPGTTFSFGLQAHSQSASNSVSLYADTAATPGATFTVTNNGSGNPIGNFSWHPTVNDIGDHILKIDAVDSSCTTQQPIAFRSSMVILIKVITGVDAGPDKYGYCALNNNPVQLEAAAGISGLSYAWTDVSGAPAIGLNNPNIYNPQAIIHNTTTYQVKVVNNGLPANCKLMDTITVHVDSANKITITPNAVVLCQPGYTTLQAQATGPAPLRNLSCGTVDIVSCTATDSADIVPDGLLPSIAHSNTATSPFYGTYITAKHQYLLRKSDLLGSGVHSATLKSLSFRLNPASSGPAVFNNLKIALKCTGMSNLSATTGQVSGTTPVYTATGPVSVVAGANGYVKFNFDKPYSWDTTQNLIVEICYANPSAVAPVYTYYISTSYISTLTTYYTSGNICGSNPAFLGPVAYTEIPQMRFNYCNADTMPFSYTWSPGMLLSDSTNASTIAYVPESTKYYVSTVGHSGCKITDSVGIYVSTHKALVWPKDTIVCMGASIVLHASSAYSYHWYEDGNFKPAVSLSCSNCANPVATPPGDREYYLIVSDSVNCRDTFKIHVTVKPLPNVKIVNSDTMIKYGQSVQLHSSGGYLYSWSPTTSLNNPNLMNPVASPLEPTEYYLTGIDSNGCRETDSIKISIDYRDHLMIPSAFTPNGDGKNDVFKIVNLSFQKVTEFRVFNRWGQEIFSTGDGQKGWDGTWKGVAQDVGVYNYIIRIAYPDGYVETYKGDVTLIR
ncbi:gliding motility-associated C-terminal domain-containing protein [Taibaiella soli]|uniref:gliding motility-associated C-terminal domain-containing protein n=1 Tax=Taibaiella soli TaxID=1649169 RepID=UPI001402983F|nr:gliding motility-associated C-terminal domain-containing protein [Taibaiella soli]